MMESKTARVAALEGYDAGQEVQTLHPPLPSEYGTYETVKARFWPSPKRGAIHALDQYLYLSGLACLKQVFVPVFILSPPLGACVDPRPARPDRTRRVGHGVLRTHPTPNPDLFFFFTLVTGPRRS